MSDWTAGLTLVLGCELQVGDVSPGFITRDVQAPPIRWIGTSHKIERDRGHRIYRVTQIEPYVLAIAVDDDGRALEGARELELCHPNDRVYVRRQTDPRFPHTCVYCKTPAYNGYNRVEHADPNVSCLAR